MHTSYLRHLLAWFLSEHRGSLPCARANPLYFPSWTFSVSTEARVSPPRRTLHFLRKPHWLRGPCGPPHQLFILPSYFTWECRNFGAKWRKNAPHPISFLGRRYFTSFPVNSNEFTFSLNVCPISRCFVSFSLALCLIYGGKAKSIIIDLPRDLVWKELLL